MQHRRVNIDARELLAAGDRAARVGHHASARQCFLEAGDSAASLGLWKAALRCYRFGLELDLFDEEIVAAVRRLPLQARGGQGWRDYEDSVRCKPDRSFGCREARITTADQTSYIECPLIGPVLDIYLDRETVEARPLERFREMPVAMAMIIVRRALWPKTENLGASSRWVSFQARAPVQLNELGDWSPRATPLLVCN